MPASPTAKMAVPRGCTGFTIQDQRRFGNRRSLIDLEVLAAASTCVQVSVVDTRHRWVGRARNEWPSGEAQLRQL